MGVRVADDLCRRWPNGVQARSPKSCELRYNTVEVHQRSVLRRFISTKSSLSWILLQSTTPRYRDLYLLEPNSFLEHLWSPLFHCDAQLLIVQHQSIGQMTVNNDVNNFLTKSCLTLYLACTWVSNPASSCFELFLCSFCFLLQFHSNQTFCVIVSSILVNCFVCESFMVIIQ